MQVKRSDSSVSRMSTSIEKRYQADLRSSMVAVVMVMNVQIRRSEPSRGHKVQSEGRLIEAAFVVLGHLAAH